MAGVEAATAELDAKRVAKSARGEALRRGLRDGGNLALAARSQLRAQPIVRRWYESVSAEFRKVPDRIGALGRAIQLGSDVAEPLADWWSRWQKDALAGLIRKMRELGEAFEEIERRLKAARRRGVQPPGERPRDPETVRAEAEVRRMLLAGETPPATLAERVEIMDLWGEEERPNRVPRWRDVALLRNARALELARTDFRLDAHGGALAGLVRLRRLGLSLQNRLDGLERLTGLTSLTVHANAAESLAPLSGLTGLTRLSLQTRGVEDPESLRMLRNVARLHLDLPRLRRLDWMKDMTALETLHLHAVRGGADLSPLAGHPSLRTIRLTGDCEVRGREALRGVTVELR